jgi:hypothetical protein
MQCCTHCLAGLCPEPVLLRLYVVLCLYILPLAGYFAPSPCAVFPFLSLFFYLSHVLPIPSLPSFQPSCARPDVLHSIQFDRSESSEPFYCRTAVLLGLATCEHGFSLRSVLVFLTWGCSPSPGERLFARGAAAADTIQARASTARVDLLQAERLLDVLGSSIIGLSQSP